MPHAKAIPLAIKLKQILSFLNSVKQFPSIPYSTHCILNRGAMFLHHIIHDNLSVKRQ